MTATFMDLKLNESLIEGLKKQGIELPTNIQANAIPPALENKDIIGQSQTGSGKTLAYLLPIFQKVDSSKREMQAIILAPTHELVMQIDKQIKTLAENAEIPMKSISIIGNVNIERQIEKLREKPHIIVGSAGRILELIKKRKINAQTVKTIVIDEGDRLLDINNIGIVKDVIKTTQRDRQLMVFSATINDRAMSISKELMKEAVVVKAEEQEQLNPNVEHLYFVAEQRDKIEVLRKLIASMEPERAIVFINRSEEIDTTTSKLKFHKLNAMGIYGAAEKQDRKKALEGFRSGKVQLLVASDLAARGLDIQDVYYIFNLDLPEEPKEYLHRAGRTGRMGKQGLVLSIVTEKEAELIKKYQNVFKINISQKEIYMGAIAEPGTKQEKKAIKNKN
ncbi:MAG: helicase [Clostridiales bacterium GWB2_37_7]|nr:MAG: helicase [Clostridiales bacterium GWB2_37_7]